MACCDLPNHQPEFDIVLLVLVKVPVEHCGDAHHFDSLDLKALMAPDSNSLSAPCP
jgi:hypothetical protein